MSFSHEYDFPVVIGTGNVLTNGHTADLKAGQFGFANAKSYALISAPVSSQEKILFASGSWHTKDKLDRFSGGLLKSDKSTEFLVKDIIAFEKSMPLKAKSEEWVLGWDGVSNDSLVFDCDTQYRFKVEVKGEAVYGTFLRPLVREIGFKTDCCDGDKCTESCNDAVPGLRYAKMIANQINTDPELKYFLQAEAIWSAAGTHTATHSLWSLTVPDDGSQMALAEVQVSTNYKVTRINRAGVYSTYQIEVPVTDADPTSYTPKTPIALAECGACPGGFTLVAASDVYSVIRPIGSADVTTPAGQAAFLTAIRADYTGDTAGTFLTKTEDAVYAQMFFPVGTTVAAVKSDILIKSHVVPASCTPTSATPVAWVEGEGRYKVSRTLRLTLEKECATGNRLTDLQAAYANQPDLASAISVLTAGTCSDIYTVTQFNKELLEDGCLTEGEPTFDSLPAFEGFVWTVVPPTDATTVDTKVGVRITAAYEDTKFGGCSFSPSDYYSARPLKLEVTALVNGPGVMQGEITDVCLAPIPSRKTRNGQMSTQTGEYVIRKLIQADRYKVGGEFYNDPRLREVMDNTHLDVVDIKSNYVLYYFKYKQFRGNQNHSADFSPEVFEAVFAFKVGTDTTAFENLVQAVSAPAKVYLKDR